MPILSRLDTTVYDVETVQNSNKLFSSDRVTPKVVLPNNVQPKTSLPFDNNSPVQYVLAARTDSRSVKLKVKLQTTDTAETYRVYALLDSGATGMFIDESYVDAQKIATRDLDQPKPVFNVDGTKNEAGSIKRTVNLIMRYGKHSERATFAVTSLGEQKVILRHSWLRLHNPVINWETQVVEMSRFPDQCRTVEKPERVRSIP